MDRIYKVFVSSTYEDLREERAEVQKALLKLKCLPVGMELFPAADDDTWEFIKTQIIYSDYYVLLVAGRYGSLSVDGLSFTEMEYDYALEMKKPAIGFVHANRGLIPRDKSEIDAERAKKLESFIAKVRSRPVRPFTTPQELALEVTTSFIDLMARRPAVGFVRADETVDFKKYSELLEANRDLERRLQELSLSASREPADWFAEDTALEITSHDGYEPKFERIVVSWREIALLIAPQVAADHDQNDMFREVAFALLSRNNNQSNLRKSDCNLHDSSKNNIRMMFFTKGLITVSTEQRVVYRQYKPQPYNARVWKFTEQGRAQLSLLASQSTAEHEPLTTADGARGT